MGGDVAEEEFDEEEDEDVAMSAIDQIFGLVVVVAVVLLDALSVVVMFVVAL